MHIKNLNIWPDHVAPPFVHGPWKHPLTVINTRKHAHFSPQAAATSMGANFKNDATYHREVWNRVCGVGGILKGDGELD